jgi:enolase
VENVLYLPRPCFNVINGGVHAGNDLDFQEFMIIPQFPSFSKNFQAGTEIYHILKETLKEAFGKSAINLGDEGGFAPPIFYPEGVLNLLEKVIKKSGYKNIKLGIDCASSEFFEDGKYKFKKKKISSKKLLNFYLEISRTYPISFLEDPFYQDDWESWIMLKSKIKKDPTGSRKRQQKSKLLIIGDDLTATNLERVKIAREKEACNGIIIKPNQIGTISETLEVVKLAKSFGWKIIASHRSGETCDDFISDLAVGIGADYIKAGAPARGERVAKYNKLLKIEEEIGKIKI